MFLENKIEEMSHTDFLHLKTGTQVWIHGIKKQPDLNGHLAQLIEHNVANDHWIVKLENGLEVALKPENLEIYKGYDDEEDTIELSENGDESVEKGTSLWSTLGTVASLIGAAVVVGAVLSTKEGEHVDVEKTTRPKKGKLYPCYKCPGGCQRHRTKKCPYKKKMMRDLESDSD